jgi:hypothetical protein
MYQKNDGTTAKVLRPTERVGTDECRPRRHERDTHPLIQQPDRVAAQKQVPQRLSTQRSLGYEGRVLAVPINMRVSGHTPHVPPK